MPSLIANIEVWNRCYLEGTVIPEKKDNQCRWPQVNRLTLTVTQSQISKYAQNEPKIHYFTVKNYSSFIFIAIRTVIHESEVVYRVESEKNSLHLRFMQINELIAN